MSTLAASPSRLTASRPEALQRGRVYGAEPKWFTPKQVLIFLEEKGYDYPAYNLGLTAQYRGKTNPYHPKTIEYALFERGMEAAWEEDQEGGPSLFSQYYLPL